MKTKKAIISFVVIIAALMIVWYFLLSGLIWFEAATEYRFVKNELTDERIKSPIYLAARNNYEAIFLKASEGSINKTDYSIKYYDEAINA